jgi:predicted CXXCH cytochrome family protein
MLVLAGSILALGLGVGWKVWKARHSPDLTRAGHDRREASWPRSPWKNAGPDLAYVGDKACARCHADIAATFRRHPMGRSLAPIASAAVGGDRPDGSTTFEAGSSRFTIERRDGREFHREARFDEAGRVLAQVEAEVKYALGSGSRGVTYLVEHDGRLFQSPISWYSQKKRWDLSPGYEHDNRHFDRSIEPTCLFCHANRVVPVNRTVNRYEEPIFRGHAIGCERCHGPGELHVRQPELVEGRDLTIVNPKYLEPARRVDVCAQCHLLGDHRVDRLDHEPFDYRPGLPLTAFFTVFGREHDGGNKAVGHVEQMKESQCFRASHGRLDCTSCHDPHQVPAPEEQVAYFREQCLACHEQNGCALPDPVRLAQSRDNDCTQCHMPKSSSLDIMHIATTDHRILRSPRAKTTEPGRAEGGLTLTLLNGESMDPRGSDALGRELAIALTSEWRDRPDAPQVRQTASLVMALLDQALARRPDDLTARRMKAEALALSGHRDDALRLIDSVLRSAPSDEHALDQYLVYAIELGDSQHALAPLRRAVEVNPWSAAFHERLAYVSMELQDWGETLQESREALRLNPFLSFARMFLIQGLLHNKDRERAEQELKTLIKLNPNRREALEQWFTEQRRNSRT